MIFFLNYIQLFFASVRQKLSQPSAKAAKAGKGGGKEEIKGFEFEYVV